MLKKKLSKSSQKESNDVITIVSGIPRSGTSMMMRMLEAGGIEVVVDDLRKADEDNPKGYYEFEKVKQIEKDTSWLKDTRGKVFKMVSRLLYDLPSDENYKIVFMNRKMEEMLSSQKVMLERKGEPFPDVENMAELYRKHLIEVENWLSIQSNMNVIYISYNDILNDPNSNLTKINKFFNYKLNVSSMINCLDCSLYRRRK